MEANCPPAEQAVLTGVSDALANLIHRPVLLTIYLIGTLSWAVAIIAAAVALSQAGARRTATIPLVCRSCRSNRSCCAFWTGRGAAIYHRRLRAQSSAHGPAYVCPDRPHLISHRRDRYWQQRRSPRRDGQPETAVCRSAGCLLGRRRSIRRRSRTLKAPPACKRG